MTNTTHARAVRFDGDVALAGPAAVEFAQDVTFSGIGRVTAVGKRESPYTGDVTETVTLTVTSVAGVTTAGPPAAIPASVVVPADPSDLLEVRQPSRAAWLTAPVPVPRWAVLAVGALVTALLMLGPAPAALADALSSPYQRCLNALKAEHARWVADPSRVVQPSECDQPTVTYAEYVKAWEAAGVDNWVAG